MFSCCRRGNITEELGSFFIEFEQKLSESAKQIQTGDLRPVNNLSIYQTQYLKFIDSFKQQPHKKQELVRAWTVFNETICFHKSYFLIHSLEIKTDGHLSDPQKILTALHGYLLDYLEITKKLDEELMYQKQWGKRTTGNLQRRAFRAIMKFETNHSPRLPIPKVPPSLTKAPNVLEEIQHEIMSAQEPWPPRVNCNNEPANPSRDEFIENLKVPCNQIIRNLYLGNGFSLLESAGCHLNGVFKPEFADIEQKLANLRSQEFFFQFDTIVSLTNVCSILTDEWMDVGEFLKLNQEKSLVERLREKNTAWHMIGNIQDASSPENWRLFVEACSRSGDQMRSFNELSITEQFEPIFKRLDEAVFGDKKVLVHCQAGISRSSSLLAAYFVNRFSISVEQAITFIRSKRNCVNPKFDRWLHQYASNLNRARMKN